MKNTKHFLVFISLAGLLISGCSNKVDNQANDSQASNPQGLAFYLQDDGTYAVGQGTASLLSNIVIPSSYMGKAVTKIIHYGFDQAGLVSITIPNTITEISRNAFNGCNKLTSISLPNSVTTIETYAFEKTGLTSIVIPASVTSMGQYVFRECDHLSEIYCEATSKPEGWENMWCVIDDAYNLHTPETIVWGYTGE